MRRVLLTLPIILLLCAAANAQIPASCVAGTNIYYISSGIGSDSNTQAQAKSKTTPWAHQPYMHNFTGTYSHTAGDCFVFRGGDTWPVASFQMSISLGGTSSAIDYYGVDLTWFAGGSFARPLFDLANNIPTGGYVIVAGNATGAQYITFDNLEIAHEGISMTAQNSDFRVGCGMQFSTFTSGGFNTATGITVKNSFLHDWSTAQAFSVVTSYLNYCNGGIWGASLVDTVEVSGANSSVNGSSLAWGGGLVLVGEVRKSKIHDGWVGCFSVVTCHDNEFYNILQNVSNNPPGGFHTQIIEEDGTGSEIVQAIYNNSIHDSNAGVNIYAYYNTQIYNNVMWNLTNNTYIYLSSPCSNSASVPGTCDSPSLVGNVYNNTLKCVENSCIHSNVTMKGALNLKNNVWINDNGTPIGLSGFAGGLNQSNNLQMTSAQATTQGYTIANKFKAFPGTSPTSVAFGVNLTAQSTGFLSALALDAEGAPWSGLTYVARPTGATAWDAGWAQSPGSGGGSPPTVTVTQPSAGPVSGQVTITVTASGGTISSVQPLVDTNTFGNACTSSPCSAPWDTTKVGNGAHTVGGTATNATGQGTATPVNVTVSNTAPGCTTSGAAWTSTSFTAQTGSFTVGGGSPPFTIMPNGIPTAGSGGPVIGLSQAAATAYTANSTLIRQSDNGFWEVYNGATGSYGHSASVSWIVGTAATFTWQVNVTGQTASVHITQNGVTSTLATNVTFRAAATSLGFWNLDPTSAPVTLTVCNFALGATGALTPASFTFPTINVGQTTSQNFTLTNNGAVSLSWSAFNISPSVFTIPSNSCVSPLAAGASCPLTVQFAPTSPTAYTGTMSLTTGGTVNSVALSGAGSSISVPSVPTGLTATASGTTIALAWTVSTGTAPITYNVNRSTTSGGPYTSIATGLTGTTFSDTNLAVATYYYVVNATNSAGTSANSAQASATITPTLPQVNLTPASLAFGNTLVSGSLAETVSNIGTANLVIGTPTLGGPNLLDFSFTAPCTGATVPPNSSCTTLVTFTPSTTTTQEQATLCFPSNAASSPDCVTMTGQGVLPVTVSPTTLAFGNIRPGATSAAQTITFTNQTGATVTFSSILVTGGDSTQFTKGTDLCGASVANNASCTVQVTFTPTNPGNRSSALVFTDSATGSPHSVTLTGNGVSRKIAKTL